MSRCFTRQTAAGVTDRGQPTERMKVIRRLLRALRMCESARVTTAVSIKIHALMTMCRGSS